MALCGLTVPLSCVFVSFADGPIPHLIIRFLWRGTDAMKSAQALVLHHEGVIATGGSIAFSIS